MRFHTSVRAIANPARHAKVIGLLLRPGAEEDALYEAAYPDPASLMRHHTVAMSGASSAFIPTTL